MNDKRVIEITADGSHTLFVPELDEHYHSVNGAIQESEHVFIEAGLKQLVKSSIRILEIGFGTGLNALLTLSQTRSSKERNIHYYTVEAFPVSLDMVRELNYADRIETVTQNDFMALHDAPWDEAVSITSAFTLCKLKGDSNQLDLPGSLDLVYFDAFAPDKQPEMWNPEIFDTLYQHMNPGGIITTYCAKGVIRRMMQSVGFMMERLPGPPGKREMLRGIK